MLEDVEDEARRLPMRSRLVAPPPPPPRSDARRCPRSRSSTPLHVRTTTLGVRSRSRRVNGEVIRDVTEIRTADLESDTQARDHSLAHKSVAISRLPRREKNIQKQTNCNRCRTSSSTTHEKTTGLAVER